MFTLIYSNSKRLLTTYAWEDEDTARVELTRCLLKHPHLEFQLSVVNILDLSLSVSMYRKTNKKGEYRIKAD
jgi:hypothetical protein